MANSSPSDVLRFWFGPAWDNKALLNDAGYTGTQSKIWYGGGPDVDAQCATFSDLIRRAGKRELSGPEWDEPTGVLAQIVLMDQLARGAFRGTAEAFAYDPVAVELTHRLLAEGVVDKLSFCEAQFALSPLIHSENLQDQETLVKQSICVAERFPGIPMSKFTVSFAESHAEVVRLFGRFPHRNDALGRTSTPEELVWLASDKVPGWAKSQQKKPSSE